MALHSGKVNRFWNFVTTTLVSLAAGIASNGLYNDYRWTAAGACAAAAGSTALLVRLRRLPPGAPLVRLLHRVFMALTFTALVAEAFGWVSHPRLVLLVAVGAVVVVLVTTPGVRMLRTLFQVAMTGIGVGYLSALLPEWDRSAVIKALIIGTLLVLATVYLVGSERGLEAVTELFATPRLDLAIRPLGGGTAFIILGVGWSFEAGPIAPMIFGSLGLAGVIV